jgi:hypothetical protein
MKSILRLATLPVLALGLGAQAQTTSPLPDRPAAAMGQYKGSWVPIVGADGMSPVAIANGTQVTLEANTGLALTVGAHYSPGFVDVKDVTFTDVPSTNDPEQAATDPNMKPTVETYGATLQANEDIPGAYAVLIGSPPNEKPDAPPSLAVRAVLIGDLQADKPQHFAARLPKLQIDGTRDWSLLVFSGGQQVRSTGMGDLLPAYFDKRDTLTLKKRIADRVAKGADAPTAAFRQMPLGLPDAIKAKYKGTTVNAKVSFGPDGRVLAAEPVGLTDPDLSAALAKGFSTWLFLPPIKSGVSTPSSAIIPLKM